MRTKGIIVVVLVFFLVGCNPQTPDGVKEGEAKLSLNGDWKFHTIYGEGSNYIDIVEETNDIVIDNSDIDYVIIKGDWNRKTQGERGSTFFKEDYLQRNFKKGDADTYVRFVPDLPSPGYYEAFVRFPFESHLTAEVNVKHAKGKDSFYFNQRNRCDEWLSLGIFTFEKLQGNYIEVTAITPASVAADAVLFRPVSEAKFNKAEKEKPTVFLPNFEDESWYDLKIPGHWGMLNEFSNYTGKGWYRKTFELPKNWQSKADERIRIQFDGVYHLAKVYLNGELIGSHQGGFTPFEFDITDNLKFDSPNVLAVEADNSALVGATWNWGGIIRDVRLVRNNDVRISYQYIHADPNLETGEADLKLKLKVENKSEKTRTLNVRSEIKKQGALAVLESSLVVPANSTKELNLETTLATKDVALWHFDTPHLYEIETTISEEDLQLHNRSDRFGIRKIELTDSSLVLNGEAVRLAGFNRVSDHRFWGSSEPQEIINKDIDLMKNVGANFMRIMHGTQNKKLIERCDEKGILIFEEVNVRELTNPEFAPPHYPLAKQWLKEMIERDLNHPSIIGWSVGNELKEHYGYVKTTMDYVKKELDPYRLVTCVSNTSHRDEATPETDPNTLVDIIMHNHYPFNGPPKETFQTIRKKWPNKPIFVSEYGIKPLSSTSLDGDIKEVSEWNNALDGINEFVVGACLWTFNDYRSGYVGTTEEENRAWGLVNAWRQKRRFHDRVQKEHSPIKSFGLTNLNESEGRAEVSILLKNTEDYPNYALNDYSLVWWLRSINGDTLSSKSVQLPVLKPGDTPWKGKINWDTSLENTVDLNIRVMSPNGYERYQKTVAFSVPKASSISDIVAGNQAVRIHFNRTVGAREYFVVYTDSEGKERQTPKTIAAFIDVSGLTNEETYKFKLLATNDKGSSSPSEENTAIPLAKPLPPVVWDAFVADNKLVIGYSGERDDSVYTVMYGADKTNLNREESANTRGMIVIDLEHENSVYFKIKRMFAAEESSWSIVKQAVTR